MSELIINELINNCVDTIKNQDDNYEIVGNRMHTPVFITLNAKDAEKEFSVMRKIFRKVWPATYSYVNMLSVKSSTDGYDFQLPEVNTNISVEDIQRRCLENSTTHPECFETLGVWSYYNIINIENLNSISEFEKLYDLGVFIEGRVVCNRTKSMLVVVLDEASYSEKKKALNIEIKNFIRERIDSENQRYQGVVFLSNKSNTGQTFVFDKDVLSLISTIVVISSNDAVGAEDDGNFDSISGVLYGGRPVTAAQCLISKPYKDIALFLIKRLIDIASVISEKQEKEEAGRINWEQVLNIVNGKIKMFNEFLRGIDISVDSEALKHMPFAVVPPEKFNPENESFASISRYMVADSLNDYIGYLVADSIKQNSLDAFFEEYEKLLFSEVSATDFARLDERSISNLVSKIRNQEPNKDQQFSKYLGAYMEYYAYKNILIPKIEKILFNIKESTQDLRKRFLRFKNEFVPYIPVVGFSHIGNAYEFAVNDYSKSREGERSLKFLFKPGNSDKEFASQLVKCVKELANQNKEKFNLPFLEHWTMMLEGTGENMHMKLMNNFGDAFESRIFYNTNYHFTASALDVYLFHTKVKGEDSDLYRYIKLNCEDNSLNCYLNTGRDSSIEAVRFYRLDNYID